MPLAARHFGRVREFAIKRIAGMQIAGGAGGGAGSAPSGTVMPITEKIRRGRNARGRAAIALIGGHTGRDTRTTRRKTARTSSSANGSAGSVRRGRASLQKPGDVKPPDGEAGVISAGVSAHGKLLAVRNTLKFSRHGPWIVMRRPLIPARTRFFPWSALRLRNMMLWDLPELAECLRRRPR